MPITRFRGVYKFLSDFYYSPIRTAFATYQTVEHIYQTCKTNDNGWKGRIIFAPTPGQAKRLGRHAPLREDWDEIMDRAMNLILKQKFSTPSLKKLLLDTRDTYLIGGNHWHDSY